MRAERPEIPADPDVKASIASLIVLADTVLAELAGVIGEMAELLRKGAT